jgi:hypothetical protein
MLMRKLQAGQVPKNELVLWLAVGIAAVTCGVWAAMLVPDERFLPGLGFGWAHVFVAWYHTVGPTFPLLITLPPAFLVWGLFRRDSGAISVANELSVSLGTLGTVLGMVDALRSLEGVTGVDGLLALVQPFCNALVSTGVGLVGLMLGVILRKLAGIDGEHGKEGGL